MFNIHVKIIKNGNPLYLIYWEVFKFSALPASSISKAWNKSSIETWSGCHYAEKLSTFHDSDISRWEFKIDVYDIKNKNWPQFFPIIQLKYRKKYSIRRKYKSFNLRVKNGNRSNCAVCCRDVVLNLSFIGKSIICEWSVQRSLEAYRSRTLNWRDWERCEKICV